MCDRRLYVRTNMELLLWRIGTESSGCNAAKFVNQVFRIVYAEHKLQQRTKPGFGLMPLARGEARRSRGAWRVQVPAEAVERRMHLSMVTWPASWFAWHSKIVRGKGEPFVIAQVSLS